MGVRRARVCLHSVGLLNGADWNERKKGLNQSLLCVGALQSSVQLCAHFADE